MGFPSPTQVLLFLVLIFLSTSFLIGFHRKTNNSGFLVLASTDPEMTQDGSSSSNGNYERVWSKKLLQVFLVRYKKEIEQSKVSRRNLETVYTLHSPTGGNNGNQGP